MKNIFKISFYLISCLFVLIILFDSLTNLYKNRKSILGKLHNHNDHVENRYLVNPLKTSDRQLPPTDLKDLKINQNSDEIGQWSAPFDWNVTAIHSVLLPDETVLTFGTFGIDKKDTNKDLKSNKKITITEGRKLDRDGGSHQWRGHDVNSGIDFDIWDPKKGIGDDSHILFKKPIVMDAFCSVVRIIDQNRVFILGGNKNMYTNQPDTQNATMIYDINKKKFYRSGNLNFKRWYASAVITGDNKMVLLGGTDVTTYEYSTTPEIVDLENLNNGWKILKDSNSQQFFGAKDSDEWNYPRAFLSSDGNIVGLSYNKLWVMDAKKNYEVFKTGEIPLVKGGINRTLKHNNPNFEGEEKNLRLLTIGSAVGSTNSAVMIGLDKVLVFGGKQKGKEYSPSNKVFQIDFKNSYEPIIKELPEMNYARSNGNATIMPDGNIFINGGHAYNDLEFSNLIPEIYNPYNETTKDMDRAYFRRNYHSTSLLLPDGRILVAGGDVWNAEIFYPPYFFTKDFNNKTVLADRPKILSIEKNIKRGQKTKLKFSGDLNRITIISTGSTTHAQGSESKFRELDFKKISDDEVEFLLSKNPNDLQNGSYLIFAIDFNGVPSKGEIVYIN